MYFILLPNLDFDYPGFPKTTLRRIKRCLLHRYWFRERIVEGEDEKFISDMGHTKGSNKFVMNICSDYVTVKGLYLRINCM